MSFESSNSNTKFNDIYSTSSIEYDNVDNSKDVIDITNYTSLDLDEYVKYDKFYINDLNENCIESMRYFFYCLSKIDKYQRFDLLKPNKSENNIFLIRNILPYLSKKSNYIMFDCLKLYVESFHESVLNDPYLIIDNFDNKIFSYSSLGTLFINNDNKSTKINQIGNNEILNWFYLNGNERFIADHKRFFCSYKNLFVVIVSFDPNYHRLIVYSNDENYYLGNYDLENDLNLSFDNFLNHNYIDHLNIKDFKNDVTFMNISSEGVLCIGFKDGYIMSIDLEWEFLQNFIGLIKTPTKEVDYCKILPFHDNNHYEEEEILNIIFIGKDTIITISSKIILIWFLKINDYVFETVELIYLPEEINNKNIKFYNKKLYFLKEKSDSLYLVKFDIRDFIPNHMALRTRSLRDITPKPPGEFGDIFNITEKDDIYLINKFQYFKLPKYNGYQYVTNFVFYQDKIIFNNGWIFLLNSFKNITNNDEEFKPIHKFYIRIPDDIVIENGYSKVYDPNTVDVIGGGYTFEKKLSNFKDNMEIVDNSIYISAYYNIYIFKI